MQKQKHLKLYPVLAKVIYILVNIVYDVNRVYLERGERLKQAKAEAEVEIETYRQQMENTFQLDGTDVSVSLCFIDSPIYIYGI